MGRHGSIALILVTDVVTVIDDGLRAMYEVTRCFPFHIGAVIHEVFLRDGIFVQLCQRDMILLVVGAHLMHVLGIDEAATNTGLHIDEVELDDTRDVAPVFFIQTVARALFGGQLKIYTRCQCHLVEAGAVVAPAVVNEAGFPVVVGCSFVIFSSHVRATVRVGLGSTLIFCSVGIVGNTNVLVGHEVYIAG